MKVHFPRLLMLSLGFLLVACASLDDNQPPRRSAANLTATPQQPQNNVNRRLDQDELAILREEIKRDFENLERRLGFIGHDRGVGEVDDISRDRDRGFLSRDASSYTLPAAAERGTSTATSTAGTRSTRPDELVPAPVPEQLRTTPTHDTPTRETLQQRQARPRARR